MSETLHQLFAESLASGSMKFEQDFVFNGVAEVNVPLHCTLDPVLIESQPMFVRQSLRRAAIRLAGGSEATLSWYGAWFGNPRCVSLRHLEVYMDLYDACLTAIHDIMGKKNSNAKSAWVWLLDEPVGEQLNSLSLKTCAVHAEAALNRLSRFPTKPQNEGSSLSSKARHDTVSLSNSDRSRKSPRPSPFRGSRPGISSQRKGRPVPPTSARNGRKPHQSHSIHSSSEFNNVQQFAELFGSTRTVLVRARRTLLNAAGEQSGKDARWLLSSARQFVFDEIVGLSFRSFTSVCRRSSLANGKAVDVDLVKRALVASCTRVLLGQLFSGCRTHCASVDAVMDLVMLENIPQAAVERGLSLFGTVLPKTPEYAPVPRVCLSESSSGPKDNNLHWMLLDRSGGGAGSGGETLNICVQTLLDSSEKTIAFMAPPRTTFSLIVTVPFGLDELRCKLVSMKSVISHNLHVDQVSPVGSLVDGDVISDAHARPSHPLHIKFRTDHRFGTEYHLVLSHYVHSAGKDSSEKDGAQRQVSDGSRADKNHRRQRRRRKDDGVVVVKIVTESSMQTQGDNDDEFDDFKKPLITKPGLASSSSSSSISKSIPDNSETNCSSKSPLIPRHPVLFLHGMAGRRKYVGASYWGGMRGSVIRQLNKNGVKAFASQSRFIASSFDRIPLVLKNFLHALDQPGNVGGRVHLIGHSQGGLDARLLITALGAANRIASVCTISSPHAGVSTPLSVPVFTGHDFRPDGMARFNFRFPVVDPYPLFQFAGVSSKKNLFCRYFSRSRCFGSCCVCCAENSGQRPLPGDEGSLLVPAATSPLFWCVGPKMVKGNQSDGVVPVPSSFAAQGYKVATLAADHWDLIFGSHRFNASQFYRNLVDFLACLDANIFVS